MNKKLKYYPITQGHIVATWHIVFLVSKYKGITPSVIVNILMQSGKLGGTFPAKQGLKLCFDYGLIDITEGILSLTELSNSQLLPKCQEEDPNISVLRTLLSHMISFHNFHWLIFYDSDPEIFRDYLYANDPEWTTLLENAKLFDFDDEDVNIWWDKILSKYEDYKEKLKKAIGDVGEKLTYHHELKRIESDGHIPSKAFVKWASRISDRFGFDVLSIRGKYFQNTYEEKGKIQIEVKSSDTSNTEMFRFYISKPEWKTALENLNSYFFFCWIGINIDNETAIDGPFIIPALELESHIPKDVSAICDWSECRCVIDISKYKIYAT